ncbi:helix-turn-helix domain-containing protein [Cohnella ginsengisoli]|uniref:Helix-turn-helix domain-containing protein n=1 Tax=Cohnella ginsengisoli TaxID=425004 RepID=A0A9X4KI42_9BACL|nr:helix-turn-helix transcriptional regulator [Cohnella ginsengisoli]MDG0791964.1 helix-turn-helix domain-containing protein [Cohnella ginsengisoli]
MNKKLRQLRLQKGVSQSFISKKLGYAHPSGYANIEMGRNGLSLKNAVIIAEILGVDVAELSSDEKLHNSNKIGA